LLGVASLTLFTNNDNRYPPSGGDWNWDATKENCEFIKQFHSHDDPFIPMDEARFIHEKTSSDFTEFTDKSHFFEPFDEVNEFVIGKAQEWTGK